MVNEMFKTVELPQSRPVCVQRTGRALELPPFVFSVPLREKILFLCVPRLKMNSNVYPGGADCKNQSTIEYYILTNLYNNKRGLSMYTTLEAHLDKGRVTVDEPQLLPPHAMVLLTVLRQESEADERATTVRDLVNKTSGIIPQIDAAQWQRDIRAEWSRL